MIIWTVASLAIGSCIGLILDSEATAGRVDSMLTVALVVLVFTVGIDLGRTWHQWKGVSRMSWTALMTPLAIALGSLAGAAGAAAIVDVRLHEALAVGAGFGWYSLSGVLVSEMHSSGLGALAFSANVAREVAALLLIPVIASRLGRLEAIAPAGATAMDTTLPLIAKVTDPETAVVAFFSGAVLSGLVPLLVPLLIRIGG